MKNVTAFPPLKLSATERLLAQLANPTSLDVTQFWHDVEAVDVPLVTTAAGNHDERDVTFLWRSEKALQGVYLCLNRVTDKSHVARGMMTHIPASDIWALQLRLPASYRGSYSITEIPQETSPELISQLGGRFTPFIGQADPFCKTASINVRGETWVSVLALDQAPEQREWAAAPAPHRGTLTASYPVVAGQQRRVRLYIPDVASSTPLGLLVLPDAETWFDHVGALGALDAAIASGRIRPLAVLGIDNNDERDRAAILGGDNQLVIDIAEHLIPQVRTAHPDRVWAGRSQTVLCGQSLGGVTALMAAVHAPDVFGAIISTSPSMWWMPDNSRRPIMFKESDTSWVSERVLSSPPQTVRIRLYVGALEGAMVPHVEQLHQRLCAAGVESQLAIYTGGHDYAWWRGALIDGLATML